MRTRMPPRFPRLLVVCIVVYRSEKNPQYLLKKSVLFGCTASAVQHFFFRTNYPPCLKIQCYWHCSSRVWVYPFEQGSDAKYWKWDTLSKYRCGKPVETDALEAPVATRINEGCQCISNTFHFVYKWLNRSTTFDELLGVD